MDRGNPVAHDEEIVAVPHRRCNAGGGVRAIGGGRHDHLYRNYRSEQGDDPSTSAVATTSTTQPVAVPPTTAPNPVRDALFEMLAADGWETYRGYGWSLMHPPEWEVFKVKPDSVLFDTGGGPFWVFLDRALATALDSEDHLEAIVPQSIDESEMTETFATAPRFMLDRDGNGVNDDPTDIAGVEFSFALDPTTGDPIPEGSSLPAWWYAYYDPADPGMDGVTFAAYANAIEDSDIVVVTFEPTVAPGLPLPSEILDDGSLLAVTTTDDGYVAVGTNPSGNFASWTSPDGLIWTPTGFESNGQGRPLDVIAAGPGLVAVGAVGPPGESTRKAVWTSSDGATTWQRVLEEPAALLGGTLFSVATQDGRLVAIGTHGECDEVAFWSDDGVEWQAGAIILDPILCASPVYDVIGGPTGFLAVGSVLSVNAGVWTSPDGETWTEHSIGSGGRMGSVVATDDGFVAVGAETFIFIDYEDTIVFGEVPARVGYVWTSPDGISWQQTTVSDSLALDELVAAPDGTLIAFGRTEAGAAAWRSTDGIRWELIPDSGMRTNLVGGPVLDDDRLVVVGGGGWTVDLTD